MADVGRPTDYTPELAARLCAKLAEGKSVRTACKDADMPCSSTVFVWLSKHPDFVEQYTRAKEESAEAHSEDMLDISDDATNDYMATMSDEDGGLAYKLNGENIQRSRLRVETRKWLASKLKPKKYGEKLTQEHTGANGGPIQYETLSTDELLAKAKAMLAQYPDLLKG